MGVDVGGDNNENFFESLEDGVILCSIMNNFRPGLVDKINPAPKAAYKKLENLTNFLAAAKRLGVKNLFESSELVERKNTVKVVRCLSYIMNETSIRFGKMPGFTLKDREVDPILAYLPKYSLRDSKTVSKTAIDLIRAQAQEWRDREALSAQIKIESPKPVNKLALEDKEKKQRAENERLEKEKRDREKREKEEKDKREKEEREKKETEQREEQEKRDREEKERIAKEKRRKEKQEKKEREQREREQREREERERREKKEKKKKKLNETKKRKKDEIEKKKKDLTEKKY